MQSYYIVWNQDSNAQLTGIKSNNTGKKPIFRLLNWSTFSGSE